MPKRDYSALNQTDLRTLVLQVADAHPDMVNPTRNLQCLYDDGADHHCVFGMLAKRMGWTCPGPDDIMNAGDAAAEFGWPLTYGAREYATSLQNIFDNVSSPGHPLPWGEAAAFIREHYTEEVV